MLRRATDAAPTEVLSVSPDISEQLATVLAEVKSIKEQQLQEIKELLQGVGDQCAKIYERIGAVMNLVLSAMPLSAHHPRLVALVPDEDLQ